MPGAPRSGATSQQARFVAEKQDGHWRTNIRRCETRTPFGFSGDTHGHESRRRRNHYLCNRGRYRRLRDGRRYSFRVNGYRAQMDMEERTYAIEISLRRTPKAFPSPWRRWTKTASSSKQLLTLKRDRTPPGKPGITAPAADGSNVEDEQRGTRNSRHRPQGTAGIIVND